MTLRIAQFINIPLLVLVAGVFWGTWFSLSRSIAGFTPEAFLAIGQRMIGNLAPVMPILMPVALLSTLPVLFLLFPQKRVFYAALAGFLLFVIATLITVVIEVPIDNQIKVWTVSSLPPDWTEIRDRWELFHTARTFASLIGLGLIVGAALFSRSQRGSE